MTNPTYNNPDSIFHGAEIISMYTRADAILDGTLIDAQLGDLQEVTRQHFGAAPVAMTKGLFALIEKGVNNKKHHNDWRGVWHDVLWMSKMANRDGLYYCTITGTGRVRKHVLKRQDTAEGIVFMLRHED